MDTTKRPGTSLPGDGQPRARTSRFRPHHGRRSTRSGARWSALVPLCLGRFLQILAVVLLVMSIPQLLLPAEMYWAGWSLAVFGLSPDPFAFNAVLLLILGTGLVRRQRAAMALTVVFELPNVVTAIWEVVATNAGFSYSASVNWSDLAAGCLAVAVIGALLLARRQFSARLQPAAHRAAALVLIGSLTVAAVGGGVLAQMSPGTLTSERDGWLWAVSASIGLEPLDDLLHHQGTRPGEFVSLYSSSISAAGLVVALLILLRTARVSRPMSASEELALRRLILDSRTEDSLAYFATRREKSVVFSADGRAAVSFRLVDGIALASGDPIGHGPAWSSAAAAFVDQSRRFGWIPAALAATEQGARCYGKLGLQARSMGEEAVIRTDERSIAELNRDPQLSAAARRAKRAGYRPRIRKQSEIHPAELQKLVELAGIWRDDGVERGFSMALSRFGDPSDAELTIVTAHAADDAVKAILVFVPWNHDGLSLDLMRRSPDALNGTTAFLVRWLVEHARDRQVTRLSLNFSMFREVLVGGERPGAGHLLRIKRRLLLALSHRWQLDSLRRANERYAPDWRTRFVCHERSASLGRVWLAAARAEGFLAPSLSKRRCRRLTLHGHGSHRPTDFAARVAELGLPLAEAATPVLRRGTHLRRARWALEQQERGAELYPATVPRTTSIAQLLCSEPLDTGKACPSGGDASSSVAGRVLRRRDHGGVLFLDISEEHTVLQVIATADGTERLSALRRVQPGDLISVTGRIGTSRTGTISLCATTWQLAAKSLHDMPRHGGLIDPETRIRQRHLDLAVNREAARVVKARSNALQALRVGLLEDGYMEVETPILQAVHGGATARPFRTRINAYRAELTLRIAPELALKRLIVAGFPQVFEIGRNFRNEGADATHNPEFTAIEAYRAYADYSDMRGLAMRLIRSMSLAVHGSTIISSPNGSAFDLADEWPVVTVSNAVSAATGTTLTVDSEFSRLVAIAQSYGLTAKPGDDAGRLIERLYEKLVEPTTGAPTFYVDFPASTSPLARGHRSSKGLAERWDLVAFGTELGTAYTELTDPFEQRARLTAQSQRAAGGDPEAMELDESFLNALEFGMPPTGGLGLGVDRIVMMLTGTTIRESITFPFVRTTALSSQA
nr:bifunctional lysylphosphatidylglycerol synthetase/lysine--tRNA ligase LysX [Plantibacter sp. VKM Ac-2885]